MKNNYSNGSGSMYADHDHKETPNMFELKIANSRGKKPVLSDIKKAHKLLSDVLAELNPCAGKDELKESRDTLWKILVSNP